MTGANRGIGLGIAECCLDNGAAKVYSIDLAEPGEELEAVSKKYPGRLLAVTANVTEEDSITAAVDKIVEQAGALHGMVVNAGRTNHKAALDFTKDDVEALFAVNVSTFFSLSKHHCHILTCFEAIRRLLHGSGCRQSFHQIEC